MKSVLRLRRQPCVRAANRALEGNTWRCTQYPGTSSAVFFQVLAAVSDHLRQACPKLSHVGKLELLFLLRQWPQFGNRLPSTLDDDHVARGGIANQLRSTNVQIANR